MKPIKYSKPTNYEHIEYNISFLPLLEIPGNEEFC
jgi:hypothetical protein